MLSINSLQGTGYIMEIGGVGGSEAGLYYHNYLWTICSTPTPPKTAEVRGCITNWGREKSTQDTNCIHTNVRGSIIVSDPHYTMVSSVRASHELESEYIGPPIYIDKHTFTSGLKKIVKTGIVTYGLQPWVKVFPDHTSKRKYHYRNYIAHGRVSGNKAWIEESYQYQYSNTGWKDVSRKSPVITITNMVTLANDSGRRPVSVIFGSYDDNSFNLSKSDWSRIKSVLYKEHPYASAPSEIFGDLCRRCAIDSVALGRNNIEFFSELPYVIDGIKDVYKLMRGKIDVKTAASLYLSYKYGVRLTISDFFDNLNDLKRQLEKVNHDFKWSHAREVLPSPYIPILCESCVDIYNYKVYYNPYDRGLKSIISEIWNYGMFPTLQNSWDLVPLSFVVDWFTDISDRLSVYDATTRFATLDIISSVSSHKRIYSGVDPRIVYPWVKATIVGKIDITIYSRHFDTGAVIAPTYVSQPGGPFDNYAEAAALIIANFGGKH